MATTKDLIRAVSYTVTALDELQRVCIDTEKQFLKIQIFLYLIGIQEEVEDYLKKVKKVAK